MIEEVMNTQQILSRKFLIENINIVDFSNNYLVEVKNNSGVQKAEDLVDNLQKLVSQATINRVKEVLEQTVKDWDVEVDIMIPTRVSHPKPIFLYLKDLKEIPMDVFEWLNEFSKHYDLKYINTKGNLFALYLYKEFDMRTEIIAKEPSLYETYEREKKSIIEREKMQDENLFDYNIRKGLTPLVSGEREKIEEEEK